MTDADQEGHWHWVSGEPVKFTNWAQSEPNNAMWRITETGKMMDEDYGVINWHFPAESPALHFGTWNDINSARNEARIATYQGVMEFQSDPR
jgi:hypothetical protein